MWLQEHFHSLNTAFKTCWMMRWLNFLFAAIGSLQPMRKMEAELESPGAPRACFILRAVEMQLTDGNGSDLLRRTPRAQTEDVEKWGLLFPQLQMKAPQSPTLSSKWIPISVEGVIEVFAAAAEPKKMDIWHISIQWAHFGGGMPRQRCCGKLVHNDWVGIMRQCFWIH